MDKLTKTLLPIPSYPRMQVLKISVIHTHVVERLDSANKQNAHTPVHLYTLWRVWPQIYTLMSITPVTVYILVYTGVQNTCAVFHPPHNMYKCTHASTPGTTARQRLREKLMQMQEVLHFSSDRHNQPHCTSNHTIATTHRAWLMAKNTGSMQNNQKTTAAHHTVATARRPNNTCSSALVLSQSTRTMARSGCWPRGRSLRRESHFLHFRELSVICIVSLIFKQRCHVTATLEPPLFFYFLGDAVMYLCPCPVGPSSSAVVLRKSSRPRPSTGLPRSLSLRQCLGHCLLTLVTQS